MKIESLNEIYGKKMEILELLLTCTNYQLRLSLNFCVNEKKMTAYFYNISRIHIKELSFPIEIHGFMISNHKQKGWEQDSMYQIFDCEDGHICFFCEDFEFYNID